MKKILSLIVLLVAFTSCEEDVKFNDPAVQALKNGEMWRGTNFTAVRGGDNSLTITATNGFETLTLRTASITPGEYTLGVNQNSKASYVVDADDIVMSYQTGTGVGNGLIKISNRPRETDIERGFITGTFYFNAFDDDNASVNFQQGIFYKVPIQAAP
jgi:hypothetical protein